MIVLAAVEITIGALALLWWLLSLLFVDDDGARLLLQGALNFVICVALVIGGIVLLHKLGIG